MMRALVLERRGRHAIVLLPGGEIRRIRAPHALAGDEILLPGQPARVPMRRFAYAAAGLAGVLAILPAALPLAQAKVVAYATVDINPSVELGLSAGGTVLTATGLDKDGHRVLATARVRGEALSAAVDTLLRTASAQGFIAEGRPAAVIVAGYGAGEASVPAAVQGQLRLARSFAATYLHHHGVKGIVSAMIVPRVLVQAAEKAHVSAGVYAVWSALHKAGAGVKVSAMRGDHLGSAMAKIATTSSGKAVLPVLTGKAKATATQPSTGVRHGQTNGSTPPSTGPQKGETGGEAPSGTTPPVTPPVTPSVGGTGRQTPATPSVQLQIVTPGGTVQLQLGGDSQEGAGTTGPGNAQGQGDGQGAGPGQGRGHGKGKKGDAGQGILPGGSSVQPGGPAQGAGGGAGQDQGNGVPGGKSDHGKGAKGQAGAEGSSGYSNLQGVGPSYWLDAWGKGHHHHGDAPDGSGLYPQGGGDGGSGLQPGGD